MKDGVRGAQYDETLEVLTVHGGPYCFGGGGGVEGVWLMPHVEVSDVCVLVVLQGVHQGLEVYLSFHVGLESYLG